MLIFAIETSCDETSAAVIKKRNGTARILSNIIASQIKLHAKTGGVVPEVAAREHIKPIIPIIKLSLKQAGIKLYDVDAIAVTNGPGLHTALSVGVETAKALSYSLGKPLIPMNHLMGHVAANWNGRKPRFPTLCLIVSGGHTELVLLRSARHIQWLGRTRDDAAGEAFDKVAQLLKLGYPGGPVISKLAAHGNPKAFDLPRPMLDRNNFDFSFSGLKTAVRYLIDPPPPRPSTSLGIPLLPRFRGDQEGTINDLCASFQAAVVDVLITKTLRAARQYQPKEVLLAGGVAANSLLRKKLKSLILNLAWKPSYRQPPLPLCTDNAGMIGLAAAIFERTSKPHAWKSVEVEPVFMRK